MIDVSSDVITFVLSCKLSGPFRILQVSVWLNNNLYIYEYIYISIDLHANIYFIKHKIHLFKKSTTFR